jgi:UV DNA damage endonuclease
MRLGFAVKVMGEAGLPSNDARRWQNNPHLRHSLGYIEAILRYCGRNDIHMYRMSSDIAPYITHPDLPQLHNQIEECARELSEVGALARRLGIRLSLHPSQYIILNAEDEDVAEKSIADLLAQARILDAMEQAEEAVVVTHVGGVYGDHRKSLDRFARRFEACPETVRRRLAVENDERSFSVRDILWLHEETGIRCIFDFQHHMLNNPDGRTLREALQPVIATWPRGVAPKIHYSSPRTEMRMVERKGRDGRRALAEQPPLLSQHADFVNPLEFVLFLQAANGDGTPGFDIMLEAKRKDQALLRLRAQLPVLGYPQYSDRVGIEPIGVPPIEIGG